MIKKIVYNVLESKDYAVMEQEINMDKYTAELRNKEDVVQWRMFTPPCAEILSVKGFQDFGR